MLEIEKDTCMIRLSDKLKKEDLQECIKFIEERKEARHYKTMTRQKEKREILCRKSNMNSRKNNFERDGCSNMHSGRYMYSGNYMYNSSNSSNDSNNDRSNQVLGPYDKLQDTYRKKWVINVSNQPLTPEREKLLAHGPNFAVVPRHPPVAQYIAVVEHACSKLEEGKVEEFRVQVKVAIQRNKRPRPNLTRGEWKALAELKKDQSRMILTADKGVVLVVLNTEDYIKKAEDLLNQNTYRVLTSDPTMKLKNRMINLLKSIKSKGGITEELYKRLYPTGAGSPKFYGLPKIHKPEMPLRPIVSSIGAVTYQTSKEVARILRHLVGKSIHHVKNTQDFLDSIKGIHLGKDQCMMSYDVKALFTSIPPRRPVTSSNRGWKKTKS